MEDILFKILPMVLAMTLSQAIYMRTDLKYHMTDRMSKKLHIKRGLMPMVAFLVLLAFTVAIVTLLEFPYFFLFVIGGLLMGIAVGMIKR